MKESLVDSQGNETELTNEKLRAMLDRKVQQIDMGYEKKLSDLKPYLLDHACQFVKEQTTNVTKLLTRQHHLTIKQFLDFKDRTDFLLEQARRRGDEVKLLEQALCLRTPVMEAEYAIDDRSPIDFYNCLIPKLREQVRFRVKKDEKFSVSDVKSQLRLRELERELERKELPKLI